MIKDRAIYNTHPTVVSINAGTEAFDKDGNEVTLDETLIQAEVERLQADYDAKQYQRDRQYPSIGEQLDMQYWDAVNGTTTWKDAIAQVKADNPKPTE